MAHLSVGPYADPRILTGPFPDRQRLLAMVADHRLDHTFVADHVSFHGGFGMDGLIQAATLLALEPTLGVQVGVYLLGLRHPVPVARQIATLCESAPGRLVLGVGVGGEDRHEVEVCGVDPSTRGRRTTESLALLRRLLTGEPVTHHGRFFDVDECVILPAPQPAVATTVGGRSEAALRRAALHGDGWLGAWVTPERYAEHRATVEAAAAEAGRTDVAWQHGVQVWVGVDADRDAARGRLAAAMQAVYRIPYERFERFCPAGTIDEVADALLPFVAAGCRTYNVQCITASTEASIAAVAELKQRLAAA
jgi:alkanesulfonate monooxygenase SsuD/methylene tetrahydromethanopterin reductase-like flavin-dependent oxidoreductase (luciferase family)